MARSWGLLMNNVDQSFWRWILSLRNQMVPRCSVEISVFDWVSGLDVIVVVSMALVVMPVANNLCSASSGGRFGFLQSPGRLLSVFSLSTRPGGQLVKTSVPTIVPHLLWPMTPLWMRRATGFSFPMIECVFTTVCLAVLLDKTRVPVDLLCPRLYGTCWATQALNCCVTLRVFC